MVQFGPRAWVSLKTNPQVSRLEVLAAVFPVDGRALYVGEVEGHFSGDVRKSYSIHHW